MRSMKLPKIGKTVLAFQLPDQWIGETEFLCSTQSHVTRSRAGLSEEISERVEELFGGLISPTPEQIASDKKEKRAYAKRVVVWEMKRIK